MWSKDLDRAQAEADADPCALAQFGRRLALTAHIQIFSGDPASAIENLEAYMKRDPHYPDMALQLVADARFALGEYEAGDRGDRAAGLRATPIPRPPTPCWLPAMGSSGERRSARSAWERGAAGQSRISRWSVAVASFRSATPRISSAVLKGFAKAASTFEAPAPFAKIGGAASAPKRIGFPRWSSGSFSGSRPHHRRLRARLYRLQIHRSARGLLGARHCGRRHPAGA